MTSVLWALVAVLVVINSLAIIVIIKQRRETASLRAQLAATKTRSAPPARAARDGAAPANLNSLITSFADLPERDVVGRYKWGDEEDRYVTLYADHTFSHQRAQKFSAYRWELSPDGLVLQWQGGTSRFNTIESPGVYVGGTARMQKVE